MRLLAQNGKILLEFNVEEYNKFILLLHKKGIEMTLDTDE